MIFTSSSKQKSDYDLQQTESCIILTIKEFSWKYADPGQEENHTYSDTTKTLTISLVTKGDSGYDAYFELDLVAETPDEERILKSGYVGRELQPNMDIRAEKFYADGDIIRLLIVCPQGVVGGSTEIEELAVDESREETIRILARAKAGSAAGVGVAYEAAKEMFSEFILLARELGFFVEEDTAKKQGLVINEDSDGWVRFSYPVETENYGLYFRIMAGVFQWSWGTGPLHGPNPVENLQYNWYDDLWESIKEGKGGKKQSGMAVLAELLVNRIT